MANKRITDLGAAQALVAADDLLPIYQPSATGVKTRKVSAATIAAINEAAITSAQSAAAAAQADATQALQDASDAGALATTAQADATQALADAATAQGTANAASATATAAQATANAAIPLIQKGAANGVAPLNASGTIDAAYLGVVATAFQGMWNATTNSPALADGVGTGGDWYFITNGTSRDLGSGAVNWTTGAMIIYDGAVWVENEGVNDVLSVNGQTGAVVLDTSDIDPTTDRQYVTDDMLDALAGTGAAPSATNKFVTDDDPRLLGLSGGNVTIDGGDLDIAYVEDGTNISGNGTLRLLSSLTNPDTGLAYTNASAAAMWPLTATEWGSIDVTQATYDDVCLQELMLLLKVNVARVTCRNRRFIVNLPNDSITIPRRSEVPLNRNTFKWQRMTIDGGNSSIKINTNRSDVTVFQRHPTSLNDAQNVQPTFLDCSVEYHNWIFVGVNAANSVAISDWASKMSSIRNCEFHNLYRGTDSRFALNMTIENNNFYNIDEYCIYQNLISSAIWADVTVPGAQTTSQMRITNCRINVKAGGTGVYLRGGDCAILRDNIIETVVGQTGNVGVFFDNAGSAQSKNFKIENTHFEGNFSDAYVRLRLSNSVTAILDNNYMQGDSGNNFYVNLDNATGSNSVILRDTGNHSGGGQWKCKYSYTGSATGVPGGGGGFVFQDTMLQGNPTDATDVFEDTDVWVLTGNDPVTGNAFVSPLLSRIKISPRLN